MEGEKGRKKEYNKEEDEKNKDNTETGYSVFIDAETSKRRKVDLEISQSRRFVEPYRF
jgi:hypothetical protein